MTIPTAPQPSPALWRRAYWSAYLGYHLRGQARYPYRSPRRIARDADRRARRIIAYAYRWVPYYRETLDRLGLTPRDFRTVDDLRQLPLISVADLQAAPERFRSTQLVADEGVTLYSSGSTGRPHWVTHELAALYQNTAHSRREESAIQAALGGGYRKLSISSSTGSGGKVMAATRRNALWPPWVDASRSHVDDYASYEEMLAALNRIQPDLVNSYGSTLGQLFTWLERNVLPFHRPRAVRYSADALAPGVRALLQDRYGIFCFSGYQAIEAFKIGWECEAHTGYHLNADLYPVRVVDEQGVDCLPGVAGEVVVSNLVNRATVLLNYRLGDLAMLLPEPCPCGRHLPLLSYVQGRTVDVLYDTQGNRHSYAVASAPIRHVAGVYHYQVVQTALDEITINLVTAPSCDRAQATSFLTAQLQAKLGADLRVTVCFVDELARTPMGKVRYVQSLIGGGDEALL